MMNDYNSLCSSTTTSHKRTWQKKIAVLLFFVMFSVFGVQGQVSVSGAVGITNGTTYTTLGAAFTAIGTSQASANIVITITGNTTESATSMTLGAGTWTSLTIAPSGGPWTVSGAATAGTPLIIFNGADNVTINGGGNLTFSNTTSSTTSGTSTLKLIGDATNNTFNNVAFLGSGNNTTGGSNTAVIWLSTGTSTGNDNNSFQGCKIGPAGTNLPSQCVVANGSTTSSTIANSNITFNNCEFYDFYTTSASAGIYAGTGNTDWNITNNKIYQTASRSQTGTSYGIYFSNSTYGNNVQITGNTIGYANNAGTGTYTLTGTGTFYGISLTALSTAATACNLNNNTITDISSASTGSVYGINNSTSASSNTININSNTIKNIALSGTATFYGVSWGSATNLSVSNNNVYSISRSGAGTIYGLYSASSSTNETINGNTIRDLTSTSASSGATYGISQGTSAGTKLFQNNTIYNFSGNAGMTFYGINVGYGTTVSISGNTIYGFTNTGGTGGAFYGINRNSTATTANIFNNKIYGFSTTSTSPLVNGIVIAGGTTNNVYNNLIGGLTATAANVADAIRGISSTSSTVTSTLNVYYNTIYLNSTSSGATFGSTGIYHTYNATATTGALDMRNNIIVNASVANGTGVSVAFRRSAATDLANYATTSNNNLFFGTSGVYNNGTTTYAFASFQTLVSTRETASKSQNPTFASTTGSDATFLNFANGAINLAGGNAQVISGYTTDYASVVRDGSAPDMGAFEFAQGTIVAPSVTSFSPATICVIGGQTVTITGTNLETVTSVLFNGSSGLTLPGIITGQTATSVTVIAPANVVDGKIRVTNPAGSVDSGSSFTAAPTPTIGVSSGVTICSGVSTTLTATGGATYSWTPSLGLNGTTSASVTASPTTTTTYTVTGISEVGCSATAVVNVTVTAAPPAITASASTTSPCLGSVINLATTSGSIPTSFSEGFETFPPASWTLLNAGSGNAWTSTTSYYKTGAKSLYYSYNSTYAADAWAFTPAQNLVAGVAYTISYWYRGSGSTYPEKLKLTVGTDVTKASQTTILADQSSITTSTFTQVTVTYTPTVTGTYYFALNCYSAANMNYLAVDDFAISGNLPATYAWTSSPAGFTSNVQNPTSVSLSQATTYTVVATANGCSKTSSVTVTPNPLPTIAVNSVTICSGGSGTTLTATGGSTYVWSPATGLSATTGTSVTANPTVTTTYTITGTDINGCVNTATSVVTVNNPVAISVQPENKVVLENASASFSVTASGTGLAYQWQVNDGSGWTDIDGETSSTYTIASAPSSLNGYLYRCTITGTCSTLTSSNATLTVGSVSITTQPTAQTICSNSSAIYSVSTTGDVTSYQWQVSTNGTTWTNIADATSATLTVSGLTSTNTGYQYHCVINNVVTSNPAGLTVYDAVAITTQPTNQSVCSGAPSVTFTAAATGSGLAYQWQVSTNGTSWNNVSGATAATYTINTPAASLNGNQYKVIVTGTSPCSAVTSNVATLTITNVTVAVSSASICIGGSTTVGATFTGAPDYTTSSWTSTTGSGAETAVSGTSATVTPTAAGTYTYTFASNGTCPFTKTVAVTVNALPIISSVTATPATVCSDANINLAAASVVNANGTVALGAGASTSSSVAASIFPGSWGGAKSQYLIKASELTALGLAAGNITSLAFEPTTSGQTYQGFFVSIASTTSSALTTTFLANGTQVYAGTLTDNGYTPVANTVNTLAFGTGSGSASSFAWDGTSNIVVTFSWSRVPSATTSTASTMKYDTASFTCTTYKQADSQTPAAMLAQTTGTTSTSRPKFTFGGVVATNLASTYNWSWNTTPAVTAATATTAVTNTSGSAVSQTFTATATNPTTGCTNSLTTSAVQINSTIVAKSCFYCS